MSKLFPRQITMLVGATPKTLIAAVEDGLASRGEILSPYQADVLSVAIETSVRDFLAQKFGAKTIEHDGEVGKVLALLWKEITGKDL